jgi:glycosyltransferase involved in cell wall biosynthesis
MSKHYALKRPVQVFPVVLDIDGIERRACERDASLSEESYNVIAVGRFFEPKGHLFLIDSFSRAWSKGMVLSLFGQGELESVYRARIAQRGMGDSIKIGGFKKNPYAVMAQADLFVFSSRYEGFGNSLLEAIVCGVPIITTDFHGMDYDLRERLREFGSLVTYGDKEELAEAIMRSRANPTHRRKVAADLKEFVVRQYGAKQRVKELAKHLLQIAGKCI